MNQSRLANTSILSNNRNNNTTSGTNDRMVKLTEKLNKISVRKNEILILYLISLILKLRK